MLDEESDNTLGGEALADQQSGAETEGVDGDSFGGEGLGKTSTASPMAGTSAGPRSLPCELSAGVIRQDYFDTDTGIVEIDMADFSHCETLVVGNGGVVETSIRMVYGVKFVGTGPTNLEIGTYTFYNGRQNGYPNTLATVTFPDGLETLTIGEKAFGQSAVGGGSNALASVAFPAGLKTLSIGSEAFQQVTSSQDTLPYSGDNALASVTFPDGLETLTMGASAFRQEAWGGNTNALTSVSFPAGLETLEVADKAFQQSSLVQNTLTEVAFPEGLKTLTLGEWSFDQSSAGVALERVGFPDSLETLTIGKYALMQSSRPGASNALASIDFPDGLKTLTIGPAAFHQYAHEGSNPLGRVIFPNGLEELTVGASAFSQSSAGGGANSLATVTFPSGLESLDVDQYAFRLTGDADYAAPVVFFPFSAGGIPDTVTLGATITAENAPWAWLGLDGASTSSWGNDTGATS